MSAPRLTTTVNLILTNIQFIGLLNQIDIKWPEEWSNFLDVFSIFNIDPQDVLGESEIPLIDFRMLFIIVSILVPLFINICILLLYQKISRIAWYSTMVFGIVMLLVGALGRILPNSGVETNESTANIYMIIGGSCVALALIVFLSFQCYKRYHPDEDTELQILAQHQYYLKFHRARAFTHFGIATFFILAGVILCGFLFKIPALSDRTTTMGTMILILGFICLAFGGIALLYCLINLPACGRKAVDAIKTFLSANLLLIFLLLLSASFIPTITWCISMFMCTTYTCPAGTKFNPRGYRPQNSYDTSAATYCDPCKFLDSNCKYSANVTELCPAWSGSRNWKNPEVPCDDEAAAYFFAAASLVLLNYLIAIPLLYKHLIDTIVPKIRSDLPLNPYLDDEDHWQRQSALCRPAASSLYDSFWLTRKYYNLLNLLHKLLIVGVLVIVAPFTNIVTVVVLVLHCFACGLMLFLKPYMNKVELGLAIALAVCNVINAVFAVAVWIQGDKDAPMPRWTTGLFILLNVILPILITVAMKCYQMKRSANEGDERELRKKEAKERFFRVVAEKQEDRMRQGIVLDQPPPEEVWNSDDWDSEEDLEDILEGGTMADATVRQRSTHSDPYATNGGGVSNGSIRQSSIQPRSESRSTTPQAKDTNSKYQRRKERRKALKHKVNLLTEAINKDTGDLMSKFFMVMGIFLFIALGAAVLGTIRQRPSPYVLGTSSIYRTTSATLATYPSWEAMTSSCCCLSSANPSVKFNLTERWVCQNGKVLERGRVTKRWVDNALPFRPLCSINFNASLSCSIVVTGDLPKLACASTARAEHPEVTNSAWDYYW
jgi:hypothetical protein